MSIENGEMEVDRGGLKWELLARPCLEKIQDNIGRKLVGRSSTVAGVAARGVAARGDLGWRKLEERSKGKKKRLFGWRLQRISGDKLVRKVVALLNDCYWK